MSQMQLTYLLRNSLSGNSKTLMVLNLSPLVNHLNESLCSLRCATKVRRSILLALTNFLISRHLRSTTRPSGPRRSRPRLTHRNLILPVPFTARPCSHHALGLPLISYVSYPLSQIPMYASIHIILHPHMRYDDLYTSPSKTSHPKMTKLTSPAPCPSSPSPSPYPSSPPSAPRSPT